MLRECAKFPNNVEQPGDNADHHVCGVLGLVRTALPVLGDSPAAALASAGTQEAFHRPTAVPTSVPS